MIRLAGSHPDWVLGYADEVWWSRLRQPRLSSWADGDPLRLIEQVSERADPDPKAPACYGLLRADTEEVWLRFVDGRPVSGVTTQFLAWSCERLRAEGKRALLLIWDNAAWHISREVRAWIQAHNHAAKREGGVRIVVCRLPTRSPWLNRIEPYWVHGKRAVVEPGRKLSAEELVTRIYDYYGCEHYPHLSK